MNDGFATRLLPGTLTLIREPVMARKSENTTPEGERIAKVIARAGLASRREAEAWIAAGRVAVNGAVITSPALNVAARDRIVVDGEPLPQRERTRLYLYNKPRGLVTTHVDPQGRPTIFGALPKNLPRLISVGRLDINTEGLLLLTNDGGLARMLELPETGWLRRYRVRALGRVTQDQLNGLKRGVTVDGVNYGPVDATLDRDQGSNVWLTFAIREGKNREVRNVLGHLGLKVNRLIRVSFGPFQLGELADGAIEEVKTRTLREQLGERLIARAGADFSGPLVERESEPPPKPPRPAPRERDTRGRDAGRPDTTNSDAKHRDTRPGHAKPRQTRPHHTKGRRPKQAHRGRHGGPRPSRPRAR
jgi:23S rRNA pseudouridine2605 synthase